MNNEEKYVRAFVEAFETTPDAAKSAVYEGIDNWDSVGHMSLIAILEETFDLMLDTDDIIDFSSYEKGKEILGKYGVEF
nr:hypothetical protein [Bifidobacterium pseudocatenulatum]